MSDTDKTVITVVPAEQVSPGMTSEAVMVVGFSTTTSWVSKIIRWATQSPVSHCYLRFVVAGQEVILHADYRGIEALGFKRFKEKNRVIVEYVVDVPWQGQIPDIVAELGTGYDFGGLIGQGVMRIGDLLGKHWENPWQDEDLWYCSEFVSHLLAGCGQELPAKPSAISPATLLTLLVGSKFATRLPDASPANG